MSKQITLTMTESQASAVSRACEFFCRIYLGQFQEISYELLFNQPLDDKYCDRRDAADHYLFEARKFIYPELHGIGHSYGVGKFEIADKAWNAYQVLRHALGDDRKPYALFGETLPECSVKEEKSSD